MPTPEGKIINQVERILKSVGRYYINIHRSGLGSDSGAPDIVTMDSNGCFCGIECKKDGESPVYTQWRHAIRILNAARSNRFIVAYGDFDIDRFDSHSFPVALIGHDEVADAFTMRLNDKKHTVEIVLE